MPPANAGPCTRAIVGLGQVCSVFSICASSSALARFCEWLKSAMRFIQPRSAPAQNAVPRPASTTRRTCGSAPNARTAALSSPIRSSFIALRTSGRLSQRVATPWVTSISRVR